MKYRIIFDRAKCVACGACAVACMDQHDTDVPFRTVLTEEGASGDTPLFAFLSVGCTHCDSAPCISACGAGCLYRDAETGLVLLNSTDCIGCGNCREACPIHHPRIDSASGKMTKCDGCNQRVKHGMKPACVKVCPFGALQLMTEEEFETAMRENAAKKISFRILGK